MKRRSSPGWQALALFTILIAALAATVGAQVDSGDQRIVSATVRSCLNLRPEAGLESVPTACMEPGTAVEVLRTEDAWARVKLTDGLEGWAAARFLASVAPGESADLAELEQGIASQQIASQQTASQEMASQEIASQEMARIAAERREAKEEKDRALAELDKFRKRLESERSSPEASGRTGLEAELATARRMLEASEASQAALRLEVAALTASLQQAEERAVRAESELERRSKDPVVTANELPVLAVAGAALAEADPAAVAESGVDVRGMLETGPAPLEPLRPAEPLVAQEPIPEVDPAPEVETAIVAWAEAWAAQNVDAYLAAYAGTFTPQNGMRRPAWEQLRHRRLVDPEFVEIELTDVEILLSSPERARATFMQVYRSDTFSDVVTKILRLVLEDGTWKIESEETSD